MTRMELPPSPPGQVIRLKRRTDVVRCCSWFDIGLTRCASIAAGDGPTWQLMVREKRMAELECREHPSRGAHGLA
jgi:hypothetical protein